MLKTFKYNDNTQLSTHFNSSEFRCKCGQVHDYIIETTLVDKLEELYKEFGYQINTLHSFEFEGASGFEKMQQDNSAYLKLSTYLIGVCKIVDACKSNLTAAPVGGRRIIN